MSIETLNLEVAVHTAVASIDDPEYPGVSIVDLGLLESIVVIEDLAEIGLIPTFSGCPALAVIAADVEAAVSAVPGITRAKVTWLRSPAWTSERITSTARHTLAQEFTVAVEISGTVTRCPRCGGITEERSLFGPSRCRSISVCSGCSETIEVVRG